MTSLKRSLVLLAAVAAVSTSIAADADQPWRKPDPAALQHWQDLRFGMFIHWGPVSLTAHEIGWSRGSQTPIEKYDSLYKEFNPVKFNADEWVSIAKNAGMKYIVLTTKHHDGFCLFDTKLTDYNIMNSPFHRDVTRELAEACRKQGLAFGAYYSVCDWHHPDFPLTSPGGKVKREKSNLDAYNDYLLGQIKELVTNAGPLITIWNDVPQMFSGRGVKTIEMVRKLQPDILINNRTGDGGDYNTPEQTIGGFNMEKPWESCMTISAHNAWAWGGEKDGVKPLSKIVEFLVCAAGGDGNMLLNVGPRPTGDLAECQVERLKEMGAWIARYGESIYGTRGGPWKPTRQLVSTRKGNTVYVHILKRPEGAITLPSLGKTIKSSCLLGGGTVKVEDNGKQTVISVAPIERPEIDTVVKLELDGSAMDIAPIKAPSSVTVKATASVVYGNSPEHGAEMAVDEDPNTRWATPAGTKQAWLAVDYGKPLEFKRVEIQEACGKRIQKFELQAMANGAWKPLLSGSTVGPHFSKAFEPVTAQQFRLNILDATEGPTISEFSLEAQ